MSDQLKLEIIEEATRDPKSLVFLRIKLLDQSGSGLPALFLPLVRQACDAWFDLLSSARDDTAIILAQNEKTDAIQRVLVICRTISSMDQSLSEEFGREGLHVLLAKIMKIDPSYYEREEDQDAVMEVQDLGGESATAAPSFPMRVAPFSHQELLDRLPLSFPITPIDDENNLRETDDRTTITILINQVKSRQSSQADVGFLMWPSAVVLSRYLVTNPDILCEKNVLELGAGCGLTGLVAGQIKASQIGGNNPESSTGVLLTDFNTTVVKNCEQNISLNLLERIVKAEELDFYKQDITVDGWLDSNGTKREQVDLILAADVICQPEDAFAAARTIFCSLKRGGKAIVVSADSKHRFGVECFEEACLQVKLQVVSTNIRHLYDGRLLMNNMEKTTGYVEDMSLTMYSVLKP
jgi:predicted nicotinamide N-methyase